MSQSSEMMNPNKFEALGFANYISTETYYVAQVASTVGLCIHVYRPLLIRSNDTIVIGFFPLVSDDYILNQYISHIMQRVTTVALTHKEYLDAGFSVPADTDLLTLKSLIFEASNKIREHPTCSV